jgi:hypothetical protein
MGERRAWNRLWALAARGWDVGPLVAALPDDARARWFRLWQQPSPTDPSPAVRARGETVEQATTALGRLTAGRDGAADDPVVAALRGPATVGAILDAGREWNADLWGERPGPGWLVLEALVRQARKEADAALVPLEVSDRGGEARRARLASRLAEAGGDVALSLALATSPDVASPATADLARRLRLLQAAGRGDEAVSALRDEVRRRQPRLDEATYRSLARTAFDLGLPDPLALVDPAAPLPGPLAAFVCDRRGVAACAGLRSIAPSDFRTALAARYARRPRPLSAEEARFALAELWAMDAGPLPSGLRRLGGAWPHATPWLASLRPGDRREAIAALDALPDDARLRALVARTPGPAAEATRLLLVRVHLVRGEDECAAALFRERLTELDSTGSLVLAPVVVSEVSGDDDEADLVGADGLPQGDAFAGGLGPWLAPFREAGKTALVADDVRAAVERRALAAPRSAAAWTLALDLSPAGPERDRALAQLERAWRLGDLDPASLAPVAQAAARVAPAEGERWLARLASGPGFDASAARARLVAAVGRKADAAAGLAGARRGGAWTAVEEVRAFDLWRSLAPATTLDSPEPWTLARRFWTRRAADPGADLGAHLRAHPLDVRAARAALRTISPGDPDAMELARRALAPPAAAELGDTWGDGRVLGLRAARTVAPFAPKAARALLADSFDPGFAADLDRRRLPGAEVRDALADVARLSATTGDAAATEAALAAFEDRAPAEARALRAAVRAAAPFAPPRAYRLQDGRPEPWRPRDLDWSAVEALLGREGVP